MNKKMKTQIGKSFSGDFGEGTWTFEMPKEFKVSAGEFAIVPLSIINDRILEVKEQKSQILKDAVKCTDETEKGIIAERNYACSLELRFLETLLN